MAELLKCLLCGYKTVRCGMANHIRAKHPAHYDTMLIDECVESLGQVKHWSKDKTQIPKRKEA